MKGMMEASVRWTLEEEGDELNLATPGNPRRLGVSLSDLANYRTSGVLVSDLQDLSEAQAREILYHKWNSAYFNALPAGVDYLGFDSAIVCESRTVRGWLSAALEDYCKRRAEASERREFLSALRTKLDTVQVLGYFSADELCGFARSFLVLRRRKHKMESTWKTTHQAWTNRVNRVQRRAFQAIGAAAQEMRSSGK